jgi:hypothetical protein
MAITRTPRLHQSAQHVYALFQAAGQPVVFPDNDGVNLTGKDGGLQLLKRFALKVSSPEHALSIGADYENRMAAATGSTILIDQSH